MEVWTCVSTAVANSKELGVVTRCRCRCISSKYCIWDPDLAFLSLGVFSALKEIELVQQLHAAGCLLLKYSYLGFYIHSTQKMRCGAHWG
jgi:arginyl-tRNA--protein-N-Asp/Glu arginylyltransferase